MSMITREPPGSWVPKRLARLSVEQYEAMVDSGVFTKRDRFTLVNGLLVAEVPKSPRHTFVTKNLARKLQAMLTSGWDIRVDRDVGVTPEAQNGSEASSDDVKGGQDGPGV